MKKTYILLIFFLFLMNQKSNCQKYYGGDDGKKLDWAISYIKDYYVDSLDHQVLVDDAIRSFITHLDPNSVYESKEESEIRKNKDRGIAPKTMGFKFYFIDGNTAIISRIIKGGPAEKAGLKQGYTINKVNGIIFNNDTYDEVKAILDDPEIEKLNISYVDFDKKTQTTTFNKDSAPWFSILTYYMLDDKTGYIKLNRFNSNTEQEFIDAAVALKSSGMKNLILDLRNNSGGVKSASIELADHFLPPNKLITYTGGHNLDREEFVSTDKKTFQKGKLICLTDDYTASSSEIFLGALQDWDRCLVMGDLSYGKGTIQQSYRLGDGSTLRITIGKYYTPAGRNLHKTDKEKWFEDYGDKFVSNQLTKDITLPKEFIGKSKSGRKLIKADGGIVPDIYFKASPEDRSLIKSLDLKGNLYRFSARYVFDNRKKLLATYKSPNDFRNDSTFPKSIRSELISFYKERSFEEVNDPNLVIPDNLYAQVKTWMADFLWGDPGYYELDNASDELISNALSVINSKKIDQLNIRSEY